MAYRIRHIPTGWFFCPSRDVQSQIDEEDGKRRYRVKSHLSKNGKIYFHKPTDRHIEKNIGKRIFTHIPIEDMHWVEWARSYEIPVKFEDWAVEEV